MIFMLANAIRFWLRKTALLRFKGAMSWSNISLIGLFHVGWVVLWCSFVLTISFTALYACLTGVDQWMSHLNSDWMIVGAWKFCYPYMFSGLVIAFKLIIGWVGIFSINHMSDILPAFNAVGTDTIIGLMTAMVAYTYAVTWVPIKAVFLILLDSPTVGIVSTIAALKASLFVHELLNFPWSLWSLLKWPFGYMLEDHLANTWLPSVISVRLVEYLAGSIASMLMIQLVRFLLGW